MTSSSISSAIQPVKPCPICHSTNLARERVLDGHEIVRCRACRFVFANLTDEHIIRTNSGYDAKATHSYSENQTTFDHIWFQKIAQRFSRLTPKGERKVLDVGCGNGILLSYFIQEGWQASGLDSSPWSQEFATRLGFHLHATTLESANLPHGHFDLITSTSTLEHIPQPLPHIAEMMRLLKPGGYLYIAGVPNYGSTSIRLGFSKFDSNAPPWHCNYFERQSVRRLFASPEITPLVGSLKISSYGIPEAFRLYYWLGRKLRIAGKSRTPAATTHRRSPHPFARAVTQAYYMSGKILYGGDKLEIIVTKKGGL